MKRIVDGKQCTANKDRNRVILKDHVFETGTQLK